MADQLWLRTRIREEQEEVVAYLSLSVSQKMLNFFYLQYFDILWHQGEHPAYKSPAAALTRGFLRETHPNTFIMVNVENILVMQKPRVCIHV